MNYEKYLMTEKKSEFEYVYNRGKRPENTKFFLKFVNDDPTQIEVWSQWGTGFIEQPDYIRGYPKFKTKEQAIQWIKKKYNMDFVKV